MSFASKAIVMGEFGAWRFNPAMWKSGKSAASAMRKQQKAACVLNLTGSMIWTYDTVEQPRLWNFVSAPEMAKVLSPINVPDVCA